MPLLLVVRPGAPSSVLLLVVRPGAPSSVLFASDCGTFGASRGMLNHFYHLRLLRDFVVFYGVDVFYCTRSMMKPHSTLLRRMESSGMDLLVFLQGVESSGTPWKRPTWNLKITEENRES